MELKNGKYISENFKKNLPFHYIFSYAREYQSAYPENVDHIKCIQSAEVLYRDYRTFQYINGGLFFPQLSSNHELITERWGPDLISDPKNPIHQLLTQIR